MVNYVELHCKTNFSFLEGASHAHELAARAIELGYRGLSVTDRDTLAGIVRAHTAAKDLGLPFYVGCELNPIDGPPRVVWGLRKGIARYHGTILQTIARIGLLGLSLVSIPEAPRKASRNRNHHR